MDFTPLPTISKCSQQDPCFPLGERHSSLSSSLHCSLAKGQETSPHGVRNKLHKLPLKGSTDGHLQAEALPAHVQQAQPTPPAPLPTHPRHSLSSGTRALPGSHTTSSPAYKDAQPCSKCLWYFHFNWHEDAVRNIHLP